jgi:translocator protein
MTGNNIIKLVISIAIPLAIGALAGYYTVQSIPGWYESLSFPSFRPPNAVFGPVWTTLYILMGIGCYLIWIKPASSDRSNALVIYAAQLLVNASWSFIFFYFKQVHIAVVVIALLWILILYMIAWFKKVSPAAAYMQLPYLLWVSFATVLNIAIWQMN